VGQIVSAYFGTDLESSPAKGNPKMGHMGWDLMPTSKHRDGSLPPKHSGQNNQFEEKKVATQRAAINIFS